MTKGKREASTPPEDVVVADIVDEAEKRYLDYSVSTIRGRSLPDVRDGLKPVHRRILYSMHGLGLRASGGTKKCARVVGDCLGRFHPHGDLACYEALIRMGQEFVYAQPLVHVQGNKGSIHDPKSFAAMRYTEAKLGHLAEELMEDLPFDTVDMVPNYDGSESEPEVLPAKLPYFLCGSNVGIAVGFVTSALPYNLGEALRAGAALIDRPRMPDDELHSMVPGPDFPTGGTIVGRSGARDALVTGRGMMTIRCDAEASDGEIRVRSTPYLVSKATLIESIVEAAKSEKDKQAAVPEILSVRDLSDKGGVDVSIRLREGADPNIVLRKLYKHTRVQDGIKASYTCIVKGRPMEIGFREAFSEWLAFRVGCLARRHEFEARKCRDSIHLLEGIVKVSADPEMAVRLIRKAKSGEEAVSALKKAFAMSARQAEYVLSMAVRKLAHYERLKVEAELEALWQKLAHHESRMNDHALIRADVKAQLLAVAKRHGTPRRTAIADSDDLSTAEEDLVREESVSVYLSRGGYIKRVAADAVSAQGRGGKGRRIGARDGDFVERVMSCSTHDDVFLATDRGKAYRIRAYQVPEHPVDRVGTHVAQIAALAQGERVTSMFRVPTEGKHDLLLLTRTGMIKRTQLEEFDNVRSNGLIAMRLAPGDEVVGCELVPRKCGSHHALVAMRSGKAARFPLNEVTTHGRDSQGVRAYAKGGASAVGMVVLEPKAKGDVILVSERGFGKRTSASEFPAKHRNTGGVLCMGFREKGDKLAGIAHAPETGTVVAVSTAKLIKVKAADVRRLKRPAFGFTLMKLGDGEAVASIGVEVSSDGQQ